MRVDTRYTKSQPADAGDTPIAEAVNIDCIEVSLARDEHDPGVRGGPQKGPEVLEHRFLVPAGERYAHQPGHDRPASRVTVEEEEVAAIGIFLRLKAAVLCHSDRLAYPIRRWTVDDGVNPPVTIDSPDLGLLLDPTPPAVQPPPSVIPRAFFAQMFKIPTLWGVADTAPYFHDNGARRLRDAVAHYQRFFNFTEAQDPVGSRSLGGFITLTDDDVDDIVAYLQLLGPRRKDN